jgi:hypothetical protein
LLSKVLFVLNYSRDEQGQAAPERNLNRQMDAFIGMDPA